MPRKLWTINLFTLIITFIYLVVGLNSSLDPQESTFQTVLVYALSPLFWSMMSYYILKRYSIETIIKMLSLYTVFASATAFIAILLYHLGYKDIVGYITENANETFSDSGVVEMKLQVYGCLVFLYPAVMQINKKSQVLKYIFQLVTILIVTIISGRGALIMSLVIGWAVFGIASRSKFMKYSLYLLLAIAIFVVILNSYNVSIANTILGFVEKLQTGGGTERTEQVSALLKGINDNYLLGSGHGVGVSYVRSARYPWRYELLPLATIFRVGLVGFIIYSIPLIVSTYKFFKKLAAGSNTIYDNYFFAGILSLSIASFTNPYLECFEFQWGYYLAFIYFLLYDNKPNNLSFNKV